MNEIIEDFTVKKNHADNLITKWMINSNVYARALRNFQCKNPNPEGFFYLPTKT